MAWASIGVGVVKGGTSIYQSVQSRKAGSKASEQANLLAQENMDMQSAQMEKNLALQKEEAAKLEIQKQKYREFQFKNPYENIESQMEDLTVDTRAAEFQAQQGQQQRANIMQGLRGAAGGSGIAGIAQALASQGQLQAQQISASIGQQERQNQMLAAQEASTIDMTERGGIAALQEMEMSRQSTLLGIQMGQTSGANAALQASYANQMSAIANQANMYGQQSASLYGLSAQQFQSGMSSLSNVGSTLAEEDAAFGDGDSGNADSGLYTQNTYTTGGGPTNLTGGNPMDDLGGY